MPTSLCRVALGLLTLTALGCQTAGGLQRKAADLLLPPADEAKLGVQLRTQILQQEHELPDPQVQAYVQSVGDKIVALDADRLPNGVHPHFTVLDDDQVNAFAVPGGDIFVLSGLLRAVHNEAELASVLSHEMGHVMERHVAQGLVAQMGAQTVAQIITGQNPSALAKVASSVAENGYLIRNTQGFERQADHDGMATMIRSEWDPHQMVSFFNDLAQQQGARPSALAAFLSSHPPPADRAQYLTQQLQAAGDKGGAANPEAIAAIQKRLPPPHPPRPAQTPQG
jgi:predicted Zn-dependent protease